jgi:hypothetical protein
MEFDIKADELGQYYIELDDESKPDSAEKHVDATIVDTSITTLKEADKEVEIEVDLDYLRQALASNCKIGKMKIKVIGKEIGLLNKILNI